MSRRVPRGGLGPEWPNEPDDGQAYGDQGAQSNGQRRSGQDAASVRPVRRDQPGPAAWPRPGIRQPADADVQLPGRGATYQGTATRAATTATAAPRYQDGRENMRRYEDPQRYDDQRYQVPGQGPGGPALPGESSPDAPPAARCASAARAGSSAVAPSASSARVVALFLVLVMFSAGQAAFKNNGQGFAANLAEWARDHYLGPVVTFGEWLSYNPPPKGGKPSFSLAVPSGEAVSPSKPAKAKAKNAFVPDIPATLKSLAGSPIAGEGQWRVVGEGQRRAGDPDHVPARRDVHVSGQRHRVDRPAAGQVLAAPGHGRPGTRRTGACPTTSRPASGRAARHVQRRVQAGLGGRRLLPERHLPRHARQGRRVGRLLQERHGQDRRVGPGLHDELLDRRRPAEPQAAG